MLKAIVSFVCFAVLSVLLFAASGPNGSGRAAPSCRLSQLTHTYHARVPPHQVVSAPPPPPALVLHVGTTGAATSHPPPPVAISVRRIATLGGWEGRHRSWRRCKDCRELSSHPGMIEAGFSRGQSVEALQAVGAKSSRDIPKAIQWSLRQGADRNLMEFRMEREVQSFEKMDFDGVRQPVSRPRPLVSLGVLATPPCFALTAHPGGAGSTLSRTDALLWGDKHRTSPSRSVASAVWSGNRSRQPIMRATSSCSAHRPSATLAALLPGNDGPMLAPAPAGSEQPAGQHARRLLLSLPPASSRGAATRAVASRGGRAQREQS